MMECTRKKIRAASLWLLLATAVFLLLCGGGEALAADTSDSASLDEIYASVTGGANEKAIYQYLTREMGFNRAAACGILANIYCESGFRPDLVEYGYTWETGGGYGICQWTNYPRTSKTGRRTNLVNYCHRNGYSYRTLTGQLHFLQYELETSYSGTLNMIRSVGNNASGAYSAAYYWCMYFEIPADTASTARYRGNLAKGTFWPAWKTESMITVKLDAAGGTCSQTAVTVPYGGKLSSLPIPTKEGCRFLGWSASLGGSYITLSTTFKDDVTLYAHYQLLSNPGTHIYFDPCGGSFANPVSIVSVTGYNGPLKSGAVVYDEAGQTPATDGASMEISVSSTGRITAIHKSGGSLKVPAGGFVFSVASEEGEAFLEKASKGMYAAVDYAASMVYLYNSHTDMLAEQCYAEGSTYGTLPVPTRTGYTFLGWYTEKDGGKRIRSSSAVSVSMLYAHWEKLTDLTEAGFTLNLSDTELAYTGSALTPAATVTCGDTVLTEGTDYTLSYSGNTAIGTAAVKAKGCGNYAGSLQATFLIIPAKTAKPQAENIKSGLQISWTAAPGVSGYQLQYSTDRSFTSAKTVQLTGADSTSKTLSRLTEGNRYYFRVRAFAVIQNETHYGSWSARCAMVRLKQTKITSAANLSSRRAKLEWNAVAGATGYQIQYSYSSDFAAAKTITVTGKTVKTLTRLTKGRICYFRVRACQILNGKRYYGAWSSVKRLKISK